MTARAVRVAGGRVSTRVDVRSVAVGAVLAAATVAAATVTLTTGDFPVPATEVLRALAGQASPGAEFIVTTLRLPRLLTGVLVGAALAVSGAVLQTVTRNPLGSPDLIGFTTGSATGALMVIVLTDGGLFAVSAGALAGGVATAIVMFALAFRRGVQGFRLILVGIGLSAMLLAANRYLITRAALYDALAAQAWLTGGLNQRGWGHVLAVGVAMGVLLPLVLGYSRRLALLELGDEAATALGVAVRRTRIVLVGASVGLAAVATAATGPIAFVALAAPQLARRLTRSAGPAIVPAAITGALLIVVSDLAVQRAFPSAQLPAGIATSAIGGVYLAWLLTRRWRQGP
jgi:iron-siderophore transport system permease protein